MLHGLHVMLTVLLQLVFSPTLSKSPTSCVNAHCSHRGSDDAQGEEEGRSGMRDCGREMAAGSLDSHPMTQHGKARERKWAWTDAATGGGEGEEQQTYRMEFPKGGGNGMPSRRVPEEGRDEDGDARSLMEEARAGHYHHLGGGKPPPSKM